MLMSTTKIMDTELITLPDLLAHWPWPRKIHPDASKASMQSADWVRSFTPFKSAKAQAAFDKCEFGLLASLAYPALSFGM